MDYEVSEYGSGQSDSATQESPRKKDDEGVLVDSVPPQTIDTQIRSGEKLLNLLQQLQNSLLRHLR